MGARWPDERAEPFRTGGADRASAGASLVLAGGRSLPGPLACQKGPLGGSEGGSAHEVGIRISVRLVRLAARPVADGDTRQPCAGDPIPVATGLSGQDRLADPAAWSFRASGPALLLAGGLGGARPGDRFRLDPARGKRVRRGLYLAASLVFPKEPGSQSDFDAHFFRVRRIVIGVMLALLVCQIGWYASIPALAVQLARPLALVLTVTLAALMLVAMATRGENWSRVAMAALVGRYVVVYLL
jgi:hypothetical protein